MSEITGLVEDYLTIQQTIKTLEAEATTIKDRIAEHYRPGSEPGKEGNTILCWVTGRRIAGILFLSENTIKYHVHSILDKLEFGDRREASQFAREHGIAKKD